jgi:predicted phosphodiesterase
MQFKGHKVIVIGDTHDSPNIPKDRFLWIGKYIRDNRPDYIIHIGDFGSFDSLSSFQANNTQQGKLKDAYMVDILSLREAMKLLNKGMGTLDVPKHCTLGNHEFRVHRFEESIPEIEGIMKNELYKSYRSNGWTTSDYGEIFFISGVGFTHCPKNIMGKEYGGKNAEIQIANDSLHDLVFGHTHKDRDWKAIKIGDKKFIRVINVGCALPMNHVEQYAKLNMTGWSYGIVEISIWDNHIQEKRFISMDRLERDYD